VEYADPRFETPQNVDKVLDFLDKHLKSKKVDNNFLCDRSLPTKYNIEKKGGY
jgi:hypothetical protein